MNGSPDFLVQRNKFLRLLENAEARRFVQDNVRSDVRELALRLPSNVHFDAKVAVQLIDCYQRAFKKLPLWSENLMALDRRSLEQSSSQRVARYRASVIQGKRLLDLTGGLGVDDVYLSASFSEVESIEKNPDLVEMSTYNDGVLQIENITRFCDDARNWNSYKIDNSTTVFVDPDRRDESGNRLYSLLDCSPPVLQWLDQILPKCSRLVIKASPMLDLTQARREVPYLEQVHIVADSGEIKEIMLLLRSGFEGEPDIIAAELSEDQVRTVSSKDLPSDKDPKPSVRPGSYLFEPAPSIIKAGLSEKYAASLNLYKAGKNPAFYFADEVVHGAQGRQWEVLEVLPLQWKQLRKRLQEQGTSRANVVRKYFSETTANILKKLKLKEGGDEYLIFMESLDGSKVCIRAMRL